MITVKLYHRQVSYCVFISICIYFEFNAFHIGDWFLYLVLHWKKLIGLSHAIHYCIFCILVFFNVLGASSNGIQSDLGLLSDNIIIALLVWQSLITIALLLCCGLYICRRKNKGFFTHRKVSSADAYIVSNINSVTTENVTQVEGPSFSGSSRMKDKKKMETNLSWAFVKTAPKYKPNGLIGSTNQFYPQDYD